jgi:hypothetical protein
MINKKSQHILPFCVSTAELALSIEDYRREVDEEFVKSKGEESATPGL